MHKGTEMVKPEEKQIHGWMSKCFIFNSLRCLTYPHVDTKQVSILDLRDTIHRDNLHHSCFTIT